jgi:hypothetical protein
MDLRDCRCKERLSQISVKRIEDLGDGVCYCLLMAHTYGSKILSESSINRTPKT